MPGLESPELTVGLALLVGVLAQVLAWHLSIPGLVVLLAAGVALGPDVAAVIVPQSLGGGLDLLVGFAVAIILFEGGLNLNLAALRRSRKAIRRLVTLGALVTALLSTVAAKLWMGWTWNVSILFGTLVIVTGPTVVGPLMKRLNVENKTAALLEAEGVLIDPIGAIIAVVALDIALQPGLTTGLNGLLDLTRGLGGGTLLGLAGGSLIAGALRVRKLIPPQLVNIFTLSAVIALFQTSEAIAHESGIPAVTVAGIVVRYLGKGVIRELDELRHFKEQLTVLMIGMLFVLLAAEVRLEDVRALGWRGAFTVLTLMLVVRPACVFVGTLGGGLRLRQRLFMSWIGPRGIVAAAVAALFSAKMTAKGMPGGAELQAMVFLVIAVTVVTAGLTGGPLAQLLGLRRRSGDGWVIMGANPLARLMARVLQDHGQHALLLDRNPAACRLAEEDGLQVLYGNALEERTLLRARVDTRAGALGMTRNEEVNLLFAQRVRHHGKLERVLLTLDDTERGVTSEMAHKAGCGVLFDQGVETEMWGQRIKRKAALPSAWVLHSLHPERPASAFQELERRHLFLPLVHIRRQVATPVHDRLAPQLGDEAVFLLDAQREAEARAALLDAGWRELHDRVTPTSISSDGDLAEPPQI